MWAHAVELVGSPRLTPAPDGATLRWQTDVPSGTRLQYGLSATALTQKAEPPGVTSQHEVRLSGLAPGTTYHYSLGSARARLATGTFTTLGAAPSPSSSASAAAPASRPSLISRVLDALSPGKKPAASPPSSPASLPAPAPPPSSAALRAPPARQTWANLATLQDHFERHGHDFASKSPEDYAAQAWRFLQSAREKNLPMKLDDTDKTLRIFDPATRSFAACNAAGRTKTFFKPGSPGYWQRQPGRAVKSRDLPTPFPAHEP